MLGQGMQLEVKKIIIFEVTGQINKKIKTSEREEIINRIIHKFKHIFEFVDFDVRIMNFGFFFFLNYSSIFLF